MSTSTGVKVVSILYYLSAFGKGMLGIGIIIFVSVLGGGLFIGVGSFILLLLGIIDGFIGNGLWNGKHWARYTAIVLSGLYVIGALIQMYFGDFFDSWITLIIHGSIAGYLLFDKDSRKYFD